MQKFLKKCGYGNVYRNNVMTPINWVVGIIETIFVIVAYSSQDLWIQIVFIVFAFLLLATYFSAYFFFAIKDPSKLQSEAYNLETQTLQAALYNTVGEEDLKIKSQKEIGAIQYVSTVMEGKNQ